MNDLNMILDVASEKHIGPNPSFSELHVAKAIETIGNQGILGRNSLSKKLQIGSGAIRTLINRLKTTNIISVSEYGCKLTDKGNSIYSELMYKIPRRMIIDAGNLATDKYSAAILVSSSAAIVKSGVEERDAVIRSGGSGATTLIYKKGKFIMKGGSRDCAKEYPDPVWNRILGNLIPNEDDVIIVVSASNVSRAEYGALAAALQLIMN